MNNNFTNHLFIKRILIILLFVNTIIVSTIFRVREFGSDEIDFQIMIKLAVWGISFTFCMFYIKLWIKKLLSFDNFFLFLLLFVIALSCFYAPSLRYSVGCAFSLIAVFSLIFLSSSLLENREILQTILAALTLVSFLSIIIYFTHPEMGRMSEFQNDGLVLGNRLSGIAGNTANAIGFNSAFAVFIAFYLKKYWSKNYLFHLYLFSTINSVSLIMSGSKTALFSLILSLLVGFFLKLSIARLALMFTLMAVILGVGALVDIELLFSMLSRSGEAEEIATGTGRTHIWLTAIDLINQKPIFGWGYGSSARILPPLSDVIGHKVTQVHNMFLQIQFSVGIFGLILFILFCTVKFCNAIKYGDDYKIAGFSFIFFTGLTEASFFVGAATSHALAFAVIFIFKYKVKNEICNSPY
jgi:exopolysaccharide production protein ExoQ